MKKLLFCWALFLSWMCHSQSYTTSIPFLMKKDGQSFSYVDKSKDETYLFVANAKKVRMIHYDAKFNHLDTLMTPIPGNKTDNMIGFSKNGSTVNLIWSSRSGEKFLFQNLDFSTKKATITSKKIEFTNETVVQTFSTNDAFYCLSILENRSTLKLYRFNSNNELEVKTIDANNSVFSDSNNQKATLYHLMSESFGSFESSFELQNIDVTVPNSLAICSKKRKAYLDANELVLTFDNNPLTTQIIAIKLDDFTSEVFKITKPAEKEVTSQTNSYYFDHHLYQVKVSMNQLFFSIKKLNGEVIKEYSVKSSEDISFKNSDFLAEWVNPFAETKITTTQQFITKMYSYQTGISCYNYNGKNLISLGGVSERIKKIDPNEQEGYGNYQPLYTGGAIGGLLAASAYVLFGGYNGTSIFNNNFKSSRNILSIHSLFSKDFELQTDKVNAYSSTKMCSYFNGFAPIKYPTFFSTNGKAYIGSYNEDAKQYVIMRFDN